MTTDPSPTEEATRLTDPARAGAGRVVRDDPGTAQRVDMRRREGRALHLAKIAADRFHANVSQRPDA